MALTDIEIAQQAEVWPISKVAEGLGLTDDELIPYGHHMAKVDVTKLRDKERRAKLVLVTAINPTPAGEGKTTTSVGLADALPTARERAYGRVKKIHFAKAHYRNDIGDKSLKRGK